MSFDLIKYNKTNRSAGIDHQKVACVYDTTVSGELALVQAYVDERGLDPSLIYGIAMGTTYSFPADLRDARDGFLREFGDWCITNGIQAVACGPNSPILMTDQGWDNDGISCSHLLSLALKYSSNGSYATTDNEASYTSQNVLAGTSTPSTLNKTDGLLREAVDGYKKGDVVLVKGVDQADFSVNAEDLSGKIALDMGRDADLYGNKFAFLPAFRIGFPNIERLGNVAITESQIRTMVQNSKAIENTTAYQKANLGVTVMANARTTRLNNGSSAYKHYVAESMGFDANLNWSYRTDSTNSMATVVSQTGLTKYGVGTANADFTVTKPAVGNTPDSTHIELGTSMYGVGDTRSLVAYNGNTFPITTGLITDFSFENCKYNPTVNVFTPGHAEQVFDLTPGAILHIATSFGHCFAPNAILNGAGAVFSAVSEPGDSGVGTGQDTIQYLLKGYEACLAGAFDTIANMQPGEIWGDGLTRYINDTPVVSDEETRDILTVEVTSETADNYGGILTGSIQAVCGAGAHAIRFFDTENKQDSGGSYIKYSIEGVYDAAAAGQNAVFSSQPAAGFVVVFSTGTSEPTLVGKQFPFESIRITDKLDASLLDVIVTRAEFGVGIDADLQAAWDAGFTIPGGIGLGDGRDYVIEYQGIDVDFVSVETWYRISAQPFPTYGIESHSKYGAGGLRSHEVFVQDVPNFINTAVVIAEESSYVTQAAQPTRTSLVEAGLTDFKLITDKSLLESGGSGGGSAPSSIISYNIIKR